jgi:hypothetical protein
MPNHIKNRIEMLGTKEQVKNVVDKFSTSFPRVLNKTHDKSSIICKDSDGKFIGWYNDSDNEFEYASERGKKVSGLPEGVEYEYNDAFIQFPNFDKVFEMPKCLKGLEPHSGIVTAVKKKYEVGISGNQLLAALELANRARQSIDFEGEEKEMFDKCCKAYEETGYAYWYDWQVANWGTKWNSYSCTKEADNVFLFDTAWSGVPSILDEISRQFPDVKFNYEWSDEDTGANCGTGVYLNGEVELNRLEDSSREAYELAFKLKPEDREYYELVDGNYEYKDED